MAKLDELQVEANHVAAPQTTPLDRVAKEVRRDSQQEADRYLDESIVPHGGE